MGEWVTVAEAAKELGCHPDTIKRRIKRGELTWQRESRPQGDRLLVQVPNGTATEADIPTPEPSSTTVEALTATVQVLNAQLEATRRDLDEERQRSRELWEWVKTQAPALQAPAHDTGANGRDTIEDTAAPPVQAPPQAPTRSWWRFW